MMPSGKALGQSLLWVFWAYCSIEAISFVGSEVKSPRTSYLRGMGIGFGVVMALYIVNAWGPGVCFGSDFVRDYGWLYYNHPDALEKLLGVAPALPSIPFYAGVCAKSAGIAVVLGVGYFLWYLNTSVAMWMGTVRAVFAMSFDRQLPLGLCKVSKGGSPTTATHFIGILALVGCFIGLGDASGRTTAAVMMAMMDYTGMYFIWTIGLAALFLPFTRPDMFEKSTFQFKWGGVPVMSILGGLVMGIGFYMIIYVGLELTYTYSQIGMAVLVVVGLALVAYMYARNRREGIDPNQIFAQIPPA
jgi:amino acid transporter